MSWRRGSYSAAMGTDGAFDRIDRYIASLRASVTIPGLALAATSRDGLVGVRTYGFAEIASRRPVEPDTLFQIGSIGKSFTACCVLQLVEEGRLDLHTPVTRYLPWFEVRSAFDEPIALHHLLTHTAGITRGADITSNSLFDVWALRTTEASAPPGAFYWYSNVGYRVIGAVIEAVEGRPYPEVLRARVLAPLGMDASEPAITNAIRPRLAQGYGPWPDDRPVLPTDPLTPAVWFETGTADGSVAATAQDMATYLRMYLNRGASDRERILSPGELRAHGRTNGRRRRGRVVRLRPGARGPRRHRVPRARRRHGRLRLVDGRGPRRRVRRGRPDQRHGLGRPHRPGGALRDPRRRGRGRRRGDPATARAPDPARVDDAGDARRALRVARR